MLGFLFGAIAGALAATYWRADLRRLRDDRMPDLRGRAADKIDGAGRVIADTVGRLSTRASSTLRSGRPASGGQDAPSAREEGTHSRGV
jgi:hypothetical protein